MLALDRASSEPRCDENPMRRSKLTVKKGRGRPDSTSGIRRAGCAVTAGISRWERHGRAMSRFRGSRSAMHVKLACVRAPEWSPATND
jgi:hypothetical protein